MAYLRDSNSNVLTNRVYQKASVAKHSPFVSVDEVRLSEKGLSPQSKRKAWKKVHDYISSYKSTILGYQENYILQLSKVHGEYLDVHINNAGDPFVQCKWINTKFLEVAVLDYFAKLWNIDKHASTEFTHHSKTYWGYFVSGGTEANLQAMFNARDYLSGLPLLNCDDIRDKGRIPQIENGHQGYDVVTSPNAFTPVAFFSEAAHYCQPKAMRVLRIDTFYDLGSGHFSCPLKYPDDYPHNFSEELLDSNGWPSSVPVDTDGSMHLPSLLKLVDCFASRGYPPIVIFTSGTSFRGNYDDPQAAIKELVPILKRNNFYNRRVYYDIKDPTKFDVRHGFWFHVDGALGASYLPFLEMAVSNGLIDSEFPDGFPVFDFRIPEVMSIAVSFHKWLGCPFPSGIYMTRKNNQLQPPPNPRIVDCPDTTLPGSRNGQVAMIMWDYLSDKSYEYLVERVMRHIEMVNFTLMKFKELEREIGQDLWVMHDRGSLFVMFKCPRSDIRRKYSLPSDTIRIRTDQGNETRLYSRVCIMDHVKEKLIEKLVEDLHDPGAFPAQSAHEINHPPSNPHLDGDEVKNKTNN